MENILALGEFHDYENKKISWKNKDIPQHQDLQLKLATASSKVGLTAGISRPGNSREIAIFFPGNSQNSTQFSWFFQGYVLTDLVMVFHLVFDIFHKLFEVFVKTW